MGKNCSLLEVQQNQIVVLHKEGHTECQIGEWLGCSKIAVYQAIVKFKELGTYSDAKQSGCPCKTTSKTDILIQKKVINFPTYSTKKIRANLNESGISVSRQTISHCLVEEFCLKSRKLRFTLKMKKKHL